MSTLVARTAAAVITAVIAAIMIVVAMRIILLTGAMITRAMTEAMTDAADALHLASGAEERYPAEFSISNARRLRRKSPGRGSTQQTPINSAAPMQREAAIQPTEGGT